MKLRDVIARIDETLAKMKDADEGTGTADPKANSDMEPLADVVDTNSGLSDTEHNAGDGTSTEIGAKGKDKKKEDLGDPLSDTEHNAGDGVSTDPADLGQDESGEEQRNKEATAQAKSKEEDNELDEVVEAYRAYLKSKKAVNEDENDNFEEEAYTRRKSSGEYEMIARKTRKKNDMPAVDTEDDIESEDDLETFEKNRKKKDQDQDQEDDNDNKSKEDLEDKEDEKDFPPSKGKKEDDFEDEKDEDGKRKSEDEDDFKIPAKRRK